jgi:hypothetical protein
MNTFLHIFSPATYSTFSDTKKHVTGFHVKHKNIATKVRKGDIFLCYLTVFSRWVGILEVTDGPFEDSSPIFTDIDDPYIIRFKIKPIVWLTPELAVPMHEESIWDHLTITKGHLKSSSLWTGFLRTSLNRFHTQDASLLVTRLKQQQSTPEVSPLSKKEKRLQASIKVCLSHPRTPDLVEDLSSKECQTEKKEERESTQIQAAIAKIGYTAGFSIWIPPNDRSSVRSEWKDLDLAILEKLPLSYDRTTMSVIERIDVLWIKGRYIERAFEVEHSTAIYSGLLRMADLLSLVPNMNINLHIVAPQKRQTKVLSEIGRPAFNAYGSRTGLVKTCSYLTYDTIKEIVGLPHLEGLKDDFIENHTIRPQ